MKKACKGSKTLTAVVLVMAMTFLGTFAHSGLTVSAAGYSGKGTRSDPYLVQTAEQLQGMKDNLSAHYKLANTIDLSGFGEFTPIGNLAKPFTGSFTCDTDSDGTPKYAIRNLTVYNHAGEKYGHKVGANNYMDYSENNSNWEAGLFGAAKGATLKNIALLDVNITNTVVGQHQMNSDWSVNPGQDEQGTGALVAMAESVTVENCSATGQISARSNHCGGMFGRLTGSSVKNSYADVTVSTTGLWCVGGFIGSGNENTVINCFAGGDVAGGSSVIAGFAGSETGTMENCYSTGTVKAGKSFVAPQSTALTARNCVTLSKCTTKNTEGNAINADSNCLVLSDAEGGCQQNFTVASRDQIQAAINAINANIKIIGDAGKYVPGTVSTSDGNGTSGAQGTDTQEPGSQGTDGEGVNGQAGTEGTATPEMKKMTAEELVSIAEDLQKKALQKKLTLEEAVEGLKLKSYYVDLSEEEMAKVPETTLNAFNAIEGEASKTALSGITKKVKELPAVEEISADNAEEIITLWEMYDGLPDSVKEYFEEDIVKKLTASYEMAEKMKDLKIVTTQVDSGMTTLQNTILILLLVLNGLALCGLFVLIFFIIRTLRRMNPQKKENKKAKVSGHAKEA